MTGGTRIGAGRPAEPNALRRDRKSDTMTWARLPAEGRLGDPPDWPLTRATGREKLLWAQEWTRPQAAMWEANHLEREVALYVRALRLAEAAKATTNLRTLVRQYMDGLGLSLRGLKEQRWIIEEQAIAGGPPAVEQDTEALADPGKDRFLRLVSDAG